MQNLVRRSGHVTRGRSLPLLDPASSRTSTGSWRHYGMGKNSQVGESFVNRGVCGLCSLRANADSDWVGPGRPPRTCISNRLRAAAAVPCGCRGRLGAAGGRGSRGGPSRRRCPPRSLREAGRNLVALKSCYILAIRIYRCGTNPLKLVISGLRTI